MHASWQYRGHLHGRISGEASEPSVRQIQQAGVSSSDGKVGDVGWLPLPLMQHGAAPASVRSAAAAAEAVPAPL